MDISSQYRLQNIVRCYKNQLLSKPLSLKHIKAVEAMSSCRTEERGVSAYECSHEDRHQSLIAHSCRHRSCSLCSARTRLLWLNEQKERLLDCPHFHCVFTLPQEYRVLWQYNQRWFTATFFDVVRSTLMDLMKDKKGPGVVPGVLMAMHTWGRQLTLHPHIHCVVTGGGIDQKNQWASTGKYLLAGRQVRALYRGRFQARIKEAYESNELRLPADQNREVFYANYKAAYAKTWCVRIEDQYAHGKGVLVYLSRYLKGGPIHPSQIVRCDAERIGFRYKDHRDKRSKVMSMKPEEFLRRLLLHVPEKGQHMVRHYGLYSAAAKEKRAKCREQLGGLQDRLESESKQEKFTLNCRCCGSGLSWRWSIYPKQIKGNSYRVESARIECPVRHIQQVDEADTSVIKKRSPRMRV